MARETKIFEECGEDRNLELHLREITDPVIGFTLQRIVLELEQIVGPAVLGRHAEDTYAEVIEAARKSIDEVRGLVPHAEDDTERIKTYDTLVMIGRSTHYYAFNPIIVAEANFEKAKLYLAKLSSEKPLDRVERANQVLKHRGNFRGLYMVIVKLNNGEYQEAINEFRRLDFCGFENKEEFEDTLFYRATKAYVSGVGALLNIPSSSGENWDQAVKFWKGACEQYIKTPGVLAKLSSELAKFKSILAEIPK